MRSTKASDSRSALEHAAWAVQWELIRVGYFTRTGRSAEAAQAQALADRWSAKRDELWEEAQG